MTTPEDELEAVLWSLMSICQVTCPNPLLFVESMISAAQSYGARDSDALTELRRAVLHRDTAEQTSPSDCGGNGGTPPELHPSGSGTGRKPTAVGGATLSTGPDVPGAGKGSGKSHPQPVDKP